MLPHDLSCFQLAECFYQKNKIVARQGHYLDDQAIAYWLSKIKILLAKLDINSTRAKLDKFGVVALSVQYLVLQFKSRLEYFN